MRALGHFVPPETLRNGEGAPGAAEWATVPVWTAMENRMSFAKSLCAAMVVSQVSMCSPEGGDPVWTGPVEVPTTPLAGLETECDSYLPVGDLRDRTNAAVADLLLSELPELEEFNYTYSTLLAHDTQGATYIYAAGHLLDLDGNWAQVSGLYDAEGREMLTSEFVIVLLRSGTTVEATATYWLGTDGSPAPAQSGFPTEVEQLHQECYPMYM